MQEFSRKLSLFAVASAVCAVVAVAQVVLADVTGKWTFSVVTENGTGTPAVVLKQDGEKLTGTYESRMLGVRPLEGSVKNDSIMFVLKGGEVELKFLGKIVDNDNIVGAVDFGGQGGASFTGKRDK